jgi:hypothetical protein
MDHCGSFLIKGLTIHCGNAGPPPKCRIFRCCRDDEYPCSEKSLEQIGVSPSGAISVAISQNATFIFFAAAMANLVIMTMT